MPVFKDEKRGTWYVMAWYRDWTGERKQKCKRGFPTKREAQDWERSFQMQTAADMDMTFEAFVELYTKDVKPRLKENTWLTKENIIQKKILPYFGKRKISEITTKDVIAWQNELLAYRDEQRKPSDGRITQMDAQADNWEDATQTDNRTDGYVQATSGVTTNTVTLGADTKVWLKDQTLYIHTENTNERYVQLDDNVRFHIRGTDENGKRDGSYTTYTNARSAMNRLGAQQADDSYLFTGNLVAVCDPATGFATAVIIKDTKFEAPANTPAPDDDDDDGETHAAATMNYGLLELASLTTVDGDWRTPVMNRLIADGYTITGWTTTGGSEAVSASKNGSSFTFDCSAAVAAATEYFTIKVDGEVVEEVVKNGTSTKKWNDVKPSTNYGTGYLDSSDDYVAYGTGTDPISSNMTAAIVIKPGYVAVPTQVTIGTATANGVTVVQNAANTNDYVRAGGSVTYAATWHTGGTATTAAATISVTLDGSATGATASVSPTSVAIGANHASTAAQAATVTVRVANADVTTVTLSAG